MPDDIARPTRRRSCDDRLLDLEPGTVHGHVRHQSPVGLPVKGSLRVSAGHGELTADGQLTGFLEIDAASVDTGNKRCDAHLRTADFLDVSTHPSLTYTFTGAGPGAGKGDVVLDGVFTAHGAERALAVPAHLTILGTDAKVTAELELDRGDWDVLNTARGASRATRVSIRAVFVRIGAGSGSSRSRP